MRLERVCSNFRENALWYLLALRLVPLFPFWLVNIASGAIGVGLRSFVLATALGIIPGSVIYCAVGAGMGATLDQGLSPDLSVIFDPYNLSIILGLAGLALIPAIVKLFKRRVTSQH